MQTTDDALKAAEPRFWSRVTKTDDCWLWGGWLNDQGYGRIHCGGRQIPVHRYSFLLHGGTMEGFDCICHRCDVPSCVNPDHLFAGDRNANNLDKMLKGRCNSPTGEKHGRAKLTLDQVVAIKLDRRKRKDIAAEYGLSIHTVDKIRSGRRWGTDKALAEALAAHRERRTTPTKDGER